MRKFLLASYAMYELNLDGIDDAYHTHSLSVENVNFILVMQEVHHLSGLEDRVRVSLGGPAVNKAVCYF